MKTITERLLADAPLVMDLGMHDGRDTRAYLDLGYRVVAVEANPHRVAEARELFAPEIASGLLTIEAVALGPIDGEVPLYVNEDNDLLSSLHFGSAARGGAACVVVAVECRRAGFLFDRHGVPQFLKVDIEGSDRLVLDALAERSERPRFVSIEMTSASDVAALVALGYRDFQLLSQAPLLAGPNPSGPFGDALPADGWIDADAVVAAYRAAGAADPLAWFDLHGRLDA